MTNKPTTRGQKKKHIITEDEIGDPSIPKENQEPEKLPAKKRGRKKKVTIVENNEPANELNQQIESPALNTTSNRKTMPSAPKDSAKRKRVDNVDTTQEPATVNEVFNEDADMQEPAAAAISKLNPINKLLELSDDDDDLLEDESRLNESVANNEREPLAPITNNSNNRIHNNVSDGMTRTYANVNRIRDNILEGSNETFESYSRLHSNTTRPNYPYNTPPPTSHSNYTHTGFNDNDLFRLNIPNMFRSNASFLTNDYEARSSFRASYSPESTLPAPFRDMMNVHQICSWLCANADILLLAYNLYLSMQTPVATPFNFISPNFNSATSATDVPKQEDKIKGNRDFLEELKCLFLRVRNPKKSAFEELIRQIFNCDLNSAEGIELLRAANRNFSDFRNKFLDGVAETIDSFKERRIRENTHTTRPLEENEIISFVDETLTINILQRWLNATNMTELKRQNSLQTLQKFVRKAFVTNYKSRDTDATKSLDRMTKNMAVPSRNGRNIASNLQL